MLKINEAFLSIQGEGYHAGEATVFIRLAGCNLDCTWCDTKYHTKVNFEFSAKELIDWLDTNIPNWDSYPITFTGGEPLLQYKAIAEFVKEINLSVHLFTPEFRVETNGTIPLPKLNIFNWITCSPKNGALPKELPINELKVVYDGTQDLDKYAGFANLSAQIEHSYLQPCAKGGSDNTQEVVDLVIRSRGIWKLSLQTHKLINIL